MKDQTTKEEVKEEVEEIVNIQIRRCKCLRCSNEWESRMKERPKYCPHCKSPYWYKPYQKDLSFPHKD